jgi:hypothetical protein
MAERRGGRLRGKREAEVGREGGSTCDDAPWPRIALMLKVLVSLGEDRDPGDGGPGKQPAYSLVPENPRTLHPNGADAGFAGRSTMPPRWLTSGPGTGSFWPHRRHRAPGGPRELPAPTFEGRYQPALGSGVRFDAGLGEGLPEPLGSRVDEEGGIQGLASHGGEWRPTLRGP